MKKKAIVTGASSGIGEAVSKELIENGYFVFGIARDFKKSSIFDEDFEQIICDITDTKKLETIIKEITDSSEINLLVNNAGIGHFGMHEDIKIEDIEKMARLNFIAPMVLSKLLIKPLKKTKGKIIHIASASALKPSPFGSAYSATKAGLIQFSESLFEEVRKNGIQSIVISPDITNTAFFNKLSFYPDDDKLASLMAKDIAQNVIWLINNPQNVAITHLQLKPQLNKIAKRKNRESDE